MTAARTIKQGRTVLDTLTGACNRACAIDACYQTIGDPGFAIDVVDRIASHPLTAT